MLQLIVQRHVNSLRIHTKLLKNEMRNILRLLQDSFQQMYRLNTLLLCSLNTRLNSLLCFNCIFV